MRTFKHGRALATALILIGATFAGGMATAAPLPTAKLTSGPAQDNVHTVQYWGWEGYGVYGPSIYIGPIYGFGYYPAPIYYPRFAYSYPGYVYDDDDYGYAYGPRRGYYDADYYDRPYRRQGARWAHVHRRD